MWSCDTFLDSNFRGKGLGKNLLWEIQEKRPVVLGLGISDMAAPVLIKNGWKVNTEVKRFVFKNKIQNPKDIIKKILQWRSFFIRHEKSADRNYSYSIVNAKELNEDIDLLWQKNENGYGNVVIRNNKYVTWKYTHHPLNRYQAIIIRKDNEIEAIGIFRYKKDCSHFVDYVGPSNSSAIKLYMLSIFFQECKDATAFDCISTDNEFQVC